MVKAGQHRDSWERNQLNQLIKGRSIVQSEEGKKRVADDYAAANAGVMADFIMRKAEWADEKGVREVVVPFSAYDIRSKNGAWLHADAVTEPLEYAAWYYDIQQSACEDAAILAAETACYETARILEDRGYSVEVRPQWNAQDACELVVFW